MKALSLFSFIVILCFFVSCRKHQDISKVNEVPVIDFASVKTFEMQDNINTITYIPLQTREDVLIEGISNVLFFNNRFYIHYSGSSVIFIFNRDGSFHQKLARQGKGPGEYLNINSFDLNPADGSLWIYDNNASKMLIYDSSLQAHEEVKLDHYFEEFLIKDTNIIYTRNLYSDGVIHERLAELDISSGEYKSIYPRSAYYDDFDLMRYDGNTLHRSGNRITFNPRFLNYIVSIENEVIDTMLVIDDKFPDEEFIDKMKADRNFARNQREVIYAITRIYEAAGILSFSVYKNIHSGKFVFSKKTGITRKIDLINENRYFGNAVIHGVADNKFISSLMLHSDFEREHYLSRIDESNLPEAEKQKLLNLEVNDNPVLILLDFKDF